VLALQAPGCAVQCVEDYNLGIRSHQDAKLTPVCGHCTICTLRIFTARCPLICAERRATRCAPRPPAPPPGVRGNVVDKNSRSTRRNAPNSAGVPLRVAGVSRGGQRELGRYLGMVEGKRPSWAKFGARG
jgi:hypothetical protein